MFRDSTCALGCIVADVRHDFVQTVGKPLSDVNEDELRDGIARASGRVESNCCAVTACLSNSTSVAHEADMHYEGQRYTLRVAVNPERLSVARCATNLKRHALRPSASI